MLVGGCAVQTSGQRHGAAMASLERDVAAAEAERAGDPVYAQCRTGYPPPGVPDPAGWVAECPGLIRAWDAKVARAQGRLDRAMGREELSRALAEERASRDSAAVTAALLAPTPRAAPVQLAPPGAAPLKLECRPSYGGGGTCIERQPFTLPPIPVPQ